MTDCLNCLKKFKDALGITRHRSQPLVSCGQCTTVEFTTAAEILNSLNRRASFESKQSSSHSQSSAYSGRLGTQSPHGFSMDLDLPPAWNPGPNSDEDDMVYHNEEVDMENDFPIPNGETLCCGAAGGHFTPYEGAARVHAQGLTFLERFNDDVYAHHRNNNLYYPFASFQDWELASFLLSSALSMAAIDRFPGIELIKALPLSFHTAKELQGCAELLPSGPKWQYCVVSTDHPMKLPVHLYWCDPLDCIESLFNNPRFAKDINLILECIYTMVERTVRIYGEWMTGKAAWTMQFKLPEDSTLLGVILSSDKTNITNMTSRHITHPLLISLANIKMAVRNKASSHTFLLTALLPITEFLHPVKHMQGVLEAHLIHQCLDIILKPLKRAAHIGHMMSDPSIKSICDPLNVKAFFAACEPNCLSGVADLFWCDWPFTNPNLFLTPEALHHWHRESYDHDVQWCIRTVSVEELDFCFSVLQPLGISKLKQITGRAQQDIQCYLVAVITNAAPPGVIIAVRALMDFCYLSQAITINEQQCQKILDALKTFHNHKHEVIAHGGHRGAKSKNILDNWYIPKLELMQSVVPSTNQVTDTTERAHITLIKDPAESTNIQNYDPQICRYLDCVKKCQHFHLATSIAQQSQDDSDDGIDDDKNANEAGDSQAAISNFWWTGHVVSNFFKKAQFALLSTTAPRPLRTFIIGSTAIHLNFDPSLRCQAINDVAEKFSLADYIQWEGQTVQNLHKLTGQHRASPTMNLPFQHLNIWFKVRVQQTPHHSGSALLPALMVNASPPDAHWKHGHYNAAIFTVDGTEQWPASGLKGHIVVEVRLIMLPVSPPGRTLPWAAHFLTYVQCLNIVPQQCGMVLDCTTQMHVLKCATRTGVMPFGDILPLDQLRSFAHIIPRFGPVADTRLMPQNSSKFTQSFLLNKYIDKDFYHTISELNAAA
ncbi:uncharacterized protein EDB91DRAFT_1238446 [Suillus paluster]|uniref:uncharacterized protein n=1 Tax=Suillus paluster TaxID=48578 RepID=UPI001B871086|nr:uncharacterized protein EDB91DRAFT_1238446 [Suillus paluster]KAG1734246.1 hypothetical protein EDB91DRAFT_1238446 [Suillus paluster]